MKNKVSRKARVFLNRPVRILQHCIVFHLWHSLVATIADLRLAESPLYVCSVEKHSGQHDLRTGPSRSSQLLDYYSTVLEDPVAKMMMEYTWTLRTFTEVALKLWLKLRAKEATGAVGQEYLDASTNRSQDLTVSLTDFTVSCVRIRLQRKSAFYCILPFFCSQ